MEDTYKKFINFFYKPESQGNYDSFKAVQKDVHETAVSKGWWDDGDRNDGEMIALMHSELDEAFDGGYNADDKVPEYKAYEAEVADCIIRIMDLAERRDWDVGGSISAHVHVVDEEHEKESYKNLTESTYLMYMHKGLSYALEGLRKPKQSDHNENFSEIEFGLAYCVLWSIKFAQRFFLRLPESLCAKAEMNKTRSYKHGGKNF